MFLTLEKLLSPEEVVAIRKTLEASEFDDGKLSAGDAVRHAKNNMQLTKSSPELDKHRATIVAALSRNEVFKLFAIPKRIVPPIFNRYDAGMEYGDHVDNAIISIMGDSVRADLSITIFLGSPDEYDGGELVMNSDRGGRQIKLPAGSAVIYNSSTIHQVQPVTRGSRYAAISWIQSLVRDEDQREMLAELAEVARWSRTQAPGSAEAMKLTKIRANLMRMWAEL